MAIKVKSSVKALFEDGDKPSGDDFVDLIDSYADNAYATAVIATIPSAATGVVSTLR